MVRPGIAIYGLYPSDEVQKNRVPLKPAMALKARIIHLKKVPAGFKVSYGSTHETQGPTTIATVPVGYADGLSRQLSNRGQMLVHGRRVPIIGRVCMDLTMLDVGSIENVQVGDEVVIFGQQNNETLTVDEMAALLNTINYEIVSTISVRVPRVYLK
jgi:alanine racemase